jgi:serine/threonine protein kinase
MQSNDADLLTGALALAYHYCGLPALRQGFCGLQANGGDLAQALQDQGHLSPKRGDKLRRGAELAGKLRSDAVYGMIALRNRLVGGAMLNACMEECRRSGYQRSLSQVLIGRDVINEKIHGAILELQADLEPDLFTKERALSAAIDLDRDSDELAEIKLAVLLGEVSAKVSFLNKGDFDAALRAQEQIARGVAPEVAMQQATAPAADAAHPPLSAASAPTTASGASSLPAPPPATPSTKSSSGEDAIKGYELIDKLGSGAMGAVLKARKRDTDEIVALKILKPELAADQEYVKRFMREAKAVGRLSHRNIIRSVQVGKSGDYYFFAMEFVEGRTVSDIMKDKGKLDELTALKIVRCIASAVHHAWQYKIVHRDIKPDNIMMSNDGDVKLTDLGLARETKRDSTLTITGVVMGSPAYISPEQATGEKNLDVRSDIYSLGATLYHMLTGVVPYDGDTPLHVMLKHMNDPVPDVKKVVPGVSDATRYFLMRMMAKRPEGRFQKASTVESVAKGIEEALAQGKVPPIPQGLAPQKARPKSRPSPSSDRIPVQAGAAKSGRSSGKRNMRTSQAGMRTSQSGAKAVSKEKKKQKEVGKRLKRMAKQRKRRF